jgi:hypothetical protein
VFCVLLVQSGHWRAAFALLLGFHGYLRHGDLANMRARDVALPGDPRMSVDNGTALLLLRKTKAGVAQSVKVDVPLFLAILHLLMVSTCPDDLLFGDCDLLELFKWAQLAAGLPSTLFVIHSLRHGGAAFDASSGARSLDKIRRRGRWRNVKTCDVYLQELEAAVLASTFPAKMVPLHQALLASPDLAWSLLGVSVSL